MTSLRGGGSSSWEGENEAGYLLDREVGVGEISNLRCLIILVVYGKVVGDK